MFVFFFLVYLSLSAKLYLNKSICSSNNLYISSSYSHFHFRKIVYQQRLADPTCSPSPFLHSPVRLTAFSSAVHCTVSFFLLPTLRIPHRSSPSLANLLFRLLLRCFARLRSFLHARADAVARPGVQSRKLLPGLAHYSSVLC